MNDTFTDWRKSSRSDANGNCVEIAARWRKSTYSDANGGCIEAASGDWRKVTYSAADGNCVEVSSSEPVVGVRDTKQHGRGPVLEFPGTAWRSFVSEVRNGSMIANVDL